MAGVGPDVAGHDAESLQRAAPPRGRRFRARLADGAGTSARHGFLKNRFDYYYVGLLFGSLASTLCGYLWLRSRYIPRWLAAFGLISSAWCVFCTLVFYIFPGFDKLVDLWWFDMPMGIFDIVTSFWLLIRGLRPAAARAARASA